MSRSRVILIARALCLAIFLALGTLHAVALDTPPETPTDGGSEGQLVSEKPGEPIWTEISSYAQLKEQFEAALGQALYLRLTCDITVGQDESLSLRSQMSVPIQQLDVGNFTISVEGSLTLPYQLCVSGAGGEKGLFHVKEGGYLELFATILTPADGYAVRQEDGGIFRYYEALELERPFPPDEQLDLAGRPVAWPDWSQYGWKHLPVAIVHKGEKLSEALPQTDAASVFSGGLYEPESRNLPVEWDLEAHTEQLEAQERFVVTGRYPDSDISVFAPPSCLVVFMKDNPAVFANLRSAGDETSLSVEGYLMLEDPSLTYWPEWSQDGDNWSQIQEPARWIKYDDKIHFGLDYTNIAFPFYLTAAVEGSDGKIHYSDTLMVEEGGRFSDHGGNRGGGEAIDDENGLPPIIDGDKPDGSTPPAPVEPETEGSSGSSNSDHSGTKEDTAGESVDNVSPPVQQAVPEAQSQPQAADRETDHTDASVKATAQPQEEPDAAQSPGSMDPQPSGASSVPAQTHGAPEPVEASAEAVAQMVAGGVLLTGVIGAGVFKSQLLRLLEKLIQFLK